MPYIPGQQRGMFPSELLLQVCDDHSVSVNSGVLICAKPMRAHIASHLPPRISGVAKLEAGEAGSRWRPSVDWICRSSLTGYQRSTKTAA